MSGRGKPVNGYRITRIVRELMAQGMSVEEAVAVRDSRKNIANGLAATLVRESGIIGAAPAPIVEESEDDIEKRITLSFKTLRKMVKSCADNNCRSLIVAGDPGLGKSHNTTEVLTEENADFTVLGGRVSGVGLYMALYQNMDEGKTLVLDDADLWNDDNAVKILKMATDSKPVRTVTWFVKGDLIDDEGNVLLKSFEYAGNLIFLTNTDLKSDARANNKDAPHKAALVDRAYYINLKLKNRRETFIHIRNVVKEQRMLEKNHGIKDEAVQDEILAFIGEHRDRFIQLSLRTVGKIAALRKYDADWQDTAIVTMTG